MNSKNKLKKTHSYSRECDICVSLIGPVGCGKSALLVKYITRRFIGEYDPSYEGCWTKCESCDGVEVNVNVMDTFDQSRKNLEKYLKWSDALILVYSITCIDSISIIHEYLEHITETIKRISEDTADVKFENKLPIKIFLLGNKIDIERRRQVSKQEVENLIEKYSNKPPSDGGDLSVSTLSDGPVNINIIHLESTSCEEYELVQNLFHRIIRDVRLQREASHHSQIIEEVLSKNQKGKANTKNRTKSPKQLGSELNTNTTHVNGGVPNAACTLPANLQGSLANSAALNILPANKDGSLKKNKFPFLNKILNKS